MMEFNSQSIRELEILNMRKYFKNLIWSVIILIMGIFIAAAVCWEFEKVEQMNIRGYAITPKRLIFGNIVNIGQT